jgi:hypothetical protein
LSLVPNERQNKTYKGTANASGEVEILKVKAGNYDVHVNAMKNPDTGEKESHEGLSHEGLGLGIKGGDTLLHKDYASRFVTIGLRTGSHDRGATPGGDCRPDPSGSYSPRRHRGLGECKC